MRIATFLTLLLLVVVAPAMAQILPSYNPVAPPPLPGTPPPLIQPLPPGPPPSWADPPKDVNPADTQVLTQNLGPGWNILSFPFARVVSVQGLSRNIYQYAGGRYYPIDPLNAPGRIDTRFAYAAFVDAPTAVTVQGVPNNFQVDSIPLASGWNLIGTPSANPLPWAAILTVKGPVIRPINLAASPGLRAGKAWISPRIFAAGSTTAALDVLAPGAALSPWQGTWVFAWHPVVLDIAPPTALAPDIRSIAPHTVQAGQVLMIAGSGFGSSPGAVMINGLPVPPGNIQTWSPTYVQVRVPDYATSGSLVVVGGGLASHRHLVEVRPTSQPGGLASVSGRVDSRTGTPLLGALVQADTGQSTLTGPDGTFTLPGLLPGTHTLTTTLLGFRRDLTDVTLAPGGTDHRLIDLPSLFSAPVAPALGNYPPVSSLNGGLPPLPALTAGPSVYFPPTGTLTVLVDTYEDGHFLWWPQHIRVEEWSNPGRQWRQDNPVFGGTATTELICDEAEAGRIYQITVSWSSVNGGPALKTTTYRTQYTNDQTVTIDSPYE